MEAKNKNYAGTDYDVVEVSYDLEGPSFDTYNFKTSIKNLKEGDLVAVDGRTGMKIAVVQKVHKQSLDTDTIKAFNLAKAWVVDKVDTSVHNHRIEVTQRKEFIMQQLAERKEAMEEVAIYKMLAESDPDAKALLAELEELK